MPMGFSSVINIFQRGNVGQQKDVARPTWLSPSIPQESLVEACHEFIGCCEGGSTVRQTHHERDYFIVHCSISRYEVNDSKD
jgi:hypothetical protein